MTRSKPRPCALCKKRPRSTHVVGPDLCDPCHEYAGWENEHSDEGHDAMSQDDVVEASYLENCPICRNVPPPWTTEEEPVNVHTKPRTARRDARTKQQHMSHARCSHPRTPAGRALCRKAMRTSDVPEPTVIEIPTFPTVKIGRGVALHLAYVLNDDAYSSLCSGGKRVLVPGANLGHEVEQRPLADVTCKNCLKLHAK